MPEFLPFRGLRYTHDDLTSVTAPPYDVIDDDERAELTRRHEHNAVRLILPDGPAATRYSGAADLLTDWQDRGVVAPDPNARFYGYRMQYRDDQGRDRSTHGVLGALTLPEAAGTGDVLPHERTLPKAKSDRLALLRATRANLDPIWGLSGAPELGAIARGGRELGRCIDPLGVRHTLRAIDDPETITALSTTVATSPVVLADGHHRFETAINYRDEQRAAGVAHPGDDAILCLLVELVAEELWVQPIHRVLSAMPSDLDLRAILTEAARIEDLGGNTAHGVEVLRARMDAGDGFGLVDRLGVALVIPDALDDPDIDSARFERDVAPRLPEAVSVDYRDDAATVAAMVDKGAGRAALLLRPVTVTQIRAAADARTRMAQKTTFFAPKPRTGMVFRSLDLAG
ncbi:MAG TPA: DUF1015 domain-containing protein [Acidimicrobiia bacterium]|nr:DUF1015 domain-containing protein [Acidimicrobiia bacterium]